MVADGVLQIGNKTHLKCVWFVYAQFLQTQLDEVVQEWNTHYIRKSRHDTVAGVPDILFHIPTSANFEDQKVVINGQQIQNLLDERDIFSEATEVIESSNDEILTSFFKYVVETEQLSIPPRNWQEARVIYEGLIQRCN